MNKKSLKMNAFLNMLRTIMGMIFPLITYPYISRVLQVNNLGKINFSNSIVGYFTLFAAFGIATYAVREGAKIRNDKMKFAKFANEMFTINLVTTVISYIVLIVLLVLVEKLHAYTWIIVIQSLAILFTTIGTDWINTIFEDFLYITVRTIVIQIMAIILMFVFVHSESDLYAYVWITLFSTAGASICNCIYCRRYVQVGVVHICNTRKHLKSMFMIFLSNMTTTIFVNSDQTMLGIFCGDYNVGLYAISVKIYTVVKNIFTSILIVAVPRISYMQTNDSEQGKKHFCSIIASILIVFVLPLAIGLLILSDYAILIVGGSEFSEAVVSLELLTIALICAAMASYMTYMIVVPSGKENILLIASTVSAVANIGLNFFLIPLWQQNGAAITTIISELIVFIVEFVFVRPKLEWKMIAKNFLQVVVACFGMVVVNFVIRKLMLNFILSTVIIIIASVIIYAIILFAFKNQFIMEIIYRRKNK